MVQIRNVPDALHRTLKARALDAGQTLSDYLLTELERLGTKKRREEMATRYGIHAKKAWGVSMSDMQKLAKRTGRDHALAGEYGLVAVFRTAAERFPSVRSALNAVSDRLLFPNSMTPDRILRELGAL